MFKIVQNISPSNIFFQQLNPFPCFSLSYSILTCYNPNCFIPVNFICASYVMSSSPPSCFSMRSSALLNFPFCTYSSVSLILLACSFFLVSNNRQVSQHILPYHTCMAFDKLQLSACPRKGADTCS